MKIKQIIVLLMILVFVTQPVSAGFFEDILSKLTGRVTENVTDESNEKEDEKICPEIPVSELCPDKETLCQQTTNEQGCPIWDCDSCETTPECIDSDGGKNYYIKGTLRISCPLVGVCPTLCRSVPAPGEPSQTCLSPSDWCADKSILNEGYCENGNIFFEQYPCSNNCQDGVCIEETNKPKQPPEPDRNVGKPEPPEEPSYEVETCAANIKVTTDKNVYYYGDNIKIKVEVSDAEGNGLANYPFRSRIFLYGDGLWHTGESGRTNEHGLFVKDDKIEKGKQPTGNINLKVTTAPNIKGCGPVEDTIEIEVKEGEDTEEVCGIGVCVPEEKKEVENIPEDEMLYTCDGCKLEGKCYPFGYRKLGKYCSENYEFIVQSEEGTCENNFECKSNVCISSECVGEGLIKKILNWFKKMFGGGEDKEDYEDGGEEICEKLLIKKDIGDYEFEEYGYGNSKEAQAPLYAENGEQLGVLNCCRAQYLYEGKHGGTAMVCPYDSRGDVMNSLKWLSARGEITSGEYKSEELYKIGGPVIVWIHEQLVIAVGGGEGPEPEMNVPLPENIADAYLEKYDNDLRGVKISKQNIPYEPRPWVACTEEDERLVKECISQPGSKLQTDPHPEKDCEVYVGCILSGESIGYHDTAKEFLIKAEMLGEVTLINFETLVDGTVLQRAERLNGKEWESLGVVFEAPSEEYLKVFGSLHPFNPLDKLSLSPGFGPFEAGGDTHDDLNIIFSEPVKAAGIYLLDLGETDERENIIFLDANNNVIKKISPWPKSTFGNPAPGTFVSLINEEGISKIEILENTQDGDDIAYDNLYFVR